jgi:hypothetical protein
MDQVERRIEGWRYDLLAQVQTNPAMQVAFTTDGCSGGQSEAWQFLSAQIPSLARRYGERPPWEACCIEHDKTYWDGPADNGFDLRKQADLELRQCIIDSGRQQAADWDDRLLLNRQQVAQAFQLAADIMYRAVRLGGIPCTVLPWRWGYGWPQCPAPTLPGTTTRQDP